MTPHDALSAIKAFQHALSGNVVSPEEVRRRDTICATCPKRKKMGRGVSKVAQFLGMIANRYRVPKDVSGFKCDVCGCALLLLLPATKEDLPVDSPEEEKQRPETCWIKNL